MLSREAEPTHTLSATCSKISFFGRFRLFDRVGKFSKLRKVTLREKRPYSE